MRAAAKSFRVNSEFDTEDALQALGVGEALVSVLDEKGVRVVIFKSPCIAVAKPVKAYQIDSDKCVGCKQCIREIGCPAIVVNDGKVQIEPSLCYGCGLCSQICKFDAIKEVARHE